MTQVYVFVFIISLVGSVAYGGYYYYQDTQNKIKILTENTVKLQQAKQAQDKTIKTLVRDAKKFRKLNKDLNVKLQKAEGYKNKLI